MTPGGEFLTTLWGEQPPGRLLLWSLATKRSRYFQSPQAAGESTRATDCDVYTGVGLAHTDHGAKRRTANAQVVAIAGLWADIDVNGGPDDKKGAAPDRDAAHELAHSIAEPTILVDSGYGLQAWWLFEGGPWRFSTYGEQRTAARAAAQWQKLLRESVRFGMDYTHDLARILRLPGTLNGKGEERVAVSVLETGPRHERDELLEIAGRAGAIDPGYSIGETRNVSVSCQPDSGPPQKLVQLVDRSPAFRRTWRHERDELPSMSETDMALVSIAALAGWEDQELADLIVHHRLVHDEADPKARRLDYIRRTVARAREHADEQREEPKPEEAAAKRAGTLTAEQWADLIGTRLESPEHDAIPLPFGDLTEAMDGGFRSGQVVLVAGWTSHGKSVIVDQFADHAAENGKSVHLYLTEMTAYARGLRLLARRGQIPFAALKRKQLKPDQWKRVLGVLNEMPYGCSIVSDWTVEDVVADIREHKWDLVVVDLIHGFHYADERDLSRSSSALVRAAKGAGGNGTVIVCAAHLNDGQMRDSRSNVRPRPGLHSLKGSSSLKQDADVVMFIWREDDPQGFPDPEGSLWIAKNRDGDLGGVEVELDPARMEFRERTISVAA